MKVLLQWKYINRIIIVRGTWAEYVHQTTSFRQRGAENYMHFRLSSSSTTVNFQARPLLVSELGHPTVSQCIAKKMAELHCMKLPMKKTPTELWENIERWVSQPPCMIWFSTLSQIFVSLSSCSWISNFSILTDLVFRTHSLLL